MPSYPTLAKRTAIVLPFITIPPGVMMSFSVVGIGLVRFFKGDATQTWPWLILVLVGGIALLLMPFYLAVFYSDEAKRAPSTRYALWGWVASSLYHVALTFFLNGWMSAHINMGGRHLRINDFQLSVPSVQVPVGLFTAACALLSLWIAIACSKHREAQPPPLPGFRIADSGVGR
jgi:purine-cytosine permease-like protein